MKSKNIIIAIIAFVAVLAIVAVPVSAGFSGLGWYNGHQGGRDGQYNIASIGIYIKNASTSQSQFLYWSCSNAKVLTNDGINGTPGNFNVIMNVPPGWYIDRITVIIDGKPTAGGITNGAVILDVIDGIHGNTNQMPRPGSSFVWCTSNIASALQGTKVPGTLTGTTPVTLNGNTAILYSTPNLPSNYLTSGTYTFDAFWFTWSHGL